MLSDVFESALHDAALGAEADRQVRHLEQRHSSSSDRQRGCSRSRQRSASERDRGRGEQDRQPGNSAIHQPPASSERWPSARMLPSDAWWASQAEPEERVGGLVEDRVRHGEHERQPDRRQQVREVVAAREPAPVRAAADRGGHERPLAHRQQLPAHDPRQRRPVRQADREHDRPGAARARAGTARPAGSRTGSGSARTARRPRASRACRRARRASPASSPTSVPDDDRGERRQRRDRERGADAGEHALGEVAADLVGAHQVRRRRAFEHVREIDRLVVRPDEAARPSATRTSAPAASLSVMPSPAGRARGRRRRPAGCRRRPGSTPRA